MRRDLASALATVRPLRLLAATGALLAVALAVPMLVGNASCSDADATVIGIGMGPEFGGAPAWTPKAYGAILWLYADKGVTLNSTTVSAWGDLSGAGHNATQGVAGSQPTFEAAGLNGRASILSPAGGGAHYLRTNALTTAGDPNITIVVSYQYVTTAATYIYAVRYGTTNTSSAWSGLGLRSLATDWWFGGQGDTLIHGGTADLNPHVLVKTSGGGLVNGYQDGVQKVTNYARAYAFNAGEPVDIFIFDISSDCRVREVIVFPSILTAAQRSKVTVYVGKRAGITVTP